MDAGLVYACPILQGRAPAVFVKPSDRPDREASFFVHADAVFPNAWTADDQGMLVSAEQFEGGKRHVVLLSLDSSSKHRAPLAARYDRFGAAVSPTGKHVAFVSLDTGSAEVFIASLPDGRDPRQISVGGGTSPVWSRDGRRLFYRSRNQMMAVDVTGHDGAITASPARLLFSGNFEERARPDWPRNYDVAPDGRFLNDPGHILHARAAHHCARPRLARRHTRDNPIGERTHSNSSVPKVRVP